MKFAHKGPGGAGAPQEQPAGALLDRASAHGSSGGRLQKAPPHGPAHAPRPHQRKWRQRVNAQLAVSVTA